MLPSPRLGPSTSSSWSHRTSTNPSFAAYLALNPWGQVPTLEDGDLVLTEAAAIMMHIADRFPAAGLSAPVGSRARSQISQWLAYLSTAFQTAYMRWFYPDRFTTDPLGSRE